MSEPRPLRLRVETVAAPEPARLRPAIEARLAGRPFPSQAEDQVARHVAEAVARRLEHEGRPWR